MSDDEWNDTQQSRLEAWWAKLDDDTCARMLKLDDDDPIPEDLTAGLSAAGGFFVETSNHPDGSDLVAHQTNAMKAFLAAKRAE